MAGELTTEERGFLRWRGVLWGASAGIVVGVIGALLAALARVGPDSWILVVIPGGIALVVGAGVGLGLAEWSGRAVAEGRSMRRIVGRAAAVAVGAVMLTITLVLFSMVSDLRFLTLRSVLVPVAIVTAVCLPAVALSLVGMWLTLRQLIRARDPRLN